MPRESCVGIPEIVGFITRGLTSVGVPPEDAARGRRFNAESDARGGRRARRIPPAAVREADPGRRGQCTAQHPNRERTRRTALIDGDNALGHLGHETRHGIGD